FVTYFIFFFFFQAEDGIRDLYVTGVQTCALPIFAVLSSLPVAVCGRLSTKSTSSGSHHLATCCARCACTCSAVTSLPGLRTTSRSEERRVGKECRSRGSPKHEKKK